MSYRPTIGLEVHAELKTKTKMFCDCLNDSEEKHPNLNVCAVCLGHPGALPTINQKAVEAVLKAGIALNGDTPQFSKFDRKNYFYPDLPKGYQISQYDLPLVFGGVLKGVCLRRIHLEEDTGRLVHELGSKNNELRDTSGHNPKFIIHNSSFVDFNRAGVPLMELVTEPDIKNAEEAMDFAKELQLILRYLGVSDADMEKGQMRIEANVSISNNDKMGTKVEVKNINSFKAVQDAIEYEIQRQEELLKSGQKVVQETRGWNENKKSTVSQRLKEEAHDYRYFPEPDLPPLDLSKFDWQALKLAIPELPHIKRLRFVKEYNLSPEQAEILAADRNTAKYFEESASELKSESAAADYQLLYNYLISDFRGLLAEKGLLFSDVKVNPENFADLIVLIVAKRVSSRTAKDILKKMLETGLDPAQILKEENLEQISGESELEIIVQSAIQENPAAVADYKKGKAQAIQFLVGKAMAKLRGRGNPEVLQQLFKKFL